MDRRKWTSKELIMAVNRSVSVIIIQMRLSTEYNKIKEVETLRVREGKLLS